MSYCSRCGDQTNQAIPEGDDRLRLVCNACGHIHYDNPKMVVGCIPEWQGKILMARRSIEPKKGEWTLPAGYLENGETIAEGARREVTEEVQATVGTLIPYALYNLPQINQVYFLFRTSLVDPSFAPGEESLEVALYDEAEIPWNNIAFKVVEKTLEKYLKDRKDNQFQFYVDDVYFKNIVLPKDPATI